MIHVIAQPNPITGVVYEFDLKGGVKYHLGDILCEVVHHTKCPPQMLSKCFMAVGDAEVDPKYLLHTFPKDGTTVIVKGAAEGDFGQLFLSIASMALMVAVPALGPVVMGIRLGTLAINIGIALVTMVLQNALFAPSQPNLSATNNKPGSAQASITGISNQSNPYGAIPKIYGRIKNYHPPIAAIPYGEIVGKVQRLRSLFMVGYGKVNISNIRIGTTPYTRFKNADLAIKYGDIESGEVSYYPRRVNQENLSIRLRGTTGWVQRRTPVNTQEIRVDITFPQGLVNIGTNNYNFNQVVEFGIQYKASNSTEWLDAPIRPVSAYIKEISNGSFKVLNFKRDLFRASVEFSVTKGVYDVRMKRITGDDLSQKEGKPNSRTQSYDQSHWTMLTCINSDSVININNTTLIALMIQADDQISGNIDTLNMTVEAEIPVRDSSGNKLPARFTRTPAWQCIDILQGDAAVRKIPDVRLNLDKFVEWAEWTDDERRYCDTVFINIGTVRSALNGIASAGRGFINVINGVFTPVFDKPQTLPRGYYGASIVKNFQTQRAMPDIPDAIIVRYPSAQGDQQVAEVWSFNEGYNKNNAVNVEIMDSPYATEARQAREDGYYMLAEGKYRPDVHSWEVPHRWLRNTVGDMVEVQHDVTMWGITSGLITGLILDGSNNVVGLEVNCLILMDADKKYDIKIACSNGTGVAKNVLTYAEERYTVTFISAHQDAPGTYAYDVGDVVLFGERGAVTQQVLIKEIKPRADGSALISAQDASYAAITRWINSRRDIGFDANVTTPPQMLLGTPPSPQILSVGSDEEFLQMSLGGTLIPAISVSVSPATEINLHRVTNIQVRFRVHDDDDANAWSTVVVSMDSDMVALLTPVVEGVAYDIEARSLTALSMASEWVGIGEPHVVVGRATIPPDVEDIYLRDKVMVWSYPNAPRDAKGFVLRYHIGDNENWDTATQVSLFPLLIAEYDLTPYADGQMTWMVKAIDDAGNLSANALALKYNFGDRLVANVAETLNIHGTFTGTKVGCSVVSSHLKADADVSPVFWGADDDPHWGADTDPYWKTTTYKQMEYYHRFEPNALWQALGKVQVSITANVQPFYVEYRFLEETPFWGADGAAFWGADGDPFWDDPEPTEWRPFTGEVSPITYSHVELHWIWNASIETQVDVSALSIIIDMPDKYKKYEDVAIATTGTYVGAGDFNVITAVRYTVQNDGSGCTGMKYDKPFVAASGVRMYALTANGTSDIEIQGY